MSSGQRTGAEEFLAAIAGGGAPGAVYAIHPVELDELRARLLTKMREEAQGGDSTIRGRLFGRGMPLSEIERLTSMNFYNTLASRLSLSGRRYEKVKEVGTLPGPKGMVYAVVRGVQPREAGADVEVVEIVKLRPYGKDWKAAVPDELEAQISDLMEGRRRAPPPANAQANRPPNAPPVAGAPPAAAGGGAPAGTPAGAPGSSADNPNPREILDLLDAAEKSLTDGKCDEYYKERMSKNFRRVTSKKALDALIGSCQRNSSTREMLLNTLKIVRGLEPKLEYEGERAVYDLSGQGLPFDRFALERLDKRWYIAE